MALSTTVDTVSQAGNGTSTDFTFPYKYISSSDFVVTLVLTATGAETSQALNTNYTVTPTGSATNGVYPGATITFTTAPASSYTVVISRDPALTQEFDFDAESDPLPVLTRHADREAMIAQRHRNRSLRLSPGTTATPSPVLPNLTGAAGKALVVNDDEDGFEFASSIEGTSVANDMEELVTSGDLTASGATHDIDFFDWARLQGLWPEQFGAARDGTTDDTTALTNWLAAVQASPARLGYMRPGIYAAVGWAPTINTNGVRIIGVGPPVSHNVGTPSGTGTVIKATGATTGHVMMTVAPTEGASTQGLDAVHIEGICFDCNGKAAKGLLVKSTRRGFFNIAAFNATGVGFEFDVSTTLGEYTDNQANVIRYYGRQLETVAGVGLKVKGNSSANGSFNTFEYVNVVHMDATAIEIENGDNNIWERCQVFCAGSATYSVDFKGGTSTNGARGETMYLSANLPPVLRGLASNTYPAARITLFLDSENSTPDPVVEYGASGTFSTFDGVDTYGPDKYNLIVNGDMALNQLAPSSNADKTAGFDGGVVLVQTGAIALTSVANPENGQAQIMRMTQSQASAQRMGYLWVIPSEDSIPLRGKGVALHMRMRFSLSADVRVAILEWTGTADAVAGDIVADWTSTTYTTAGFFEGTTKNLLAIIENACTAATFRNASGAVAAGGLTANIGANCTNILVFAWTEGTAAQNATLDLGQVTLVPGFMPNANIRESRAASIRRAYRQVQKSYTLSVAPATSSELGAVEFATRAAAGDQLDRVYCRLEPMIAVPTATIYSATGASGNIRNVTDGNDITAAADHVGGSGFCMKPTANVTAEKRYAFHWTATAYPWT